MARTIAFAWLLLGCGGSAPVMPVTPTMPAVAVDRPIDRCKVAGSDAFDFLLGKWRTSEIHHDGADDNGQLHATSDIEVRTILDGCAIAERWTWRDHGNVLFRSILIHAFDRAANRWMLTYIDHELNHQRYEGRPHDGGWAFHHRTESDGKAVHVRIVWEKTGTGVTQRIERSTDGEATWKVGSIVQYSR